MSERQRPVGQQIARHWPPTSVMEVEWSSHFTNVSHRRLRGSLEGNPQPGDRLRFVFVFVLRVACVRAGEAKLRVRARCRVFLLTLASALGSSVPFAAPLRSPGRGVYVGFKAKWVQICAALLSLRVFYVGFMRVLHKTHVYGMGFMMNPLKTHVWCISCRKNLIKTRV